MDDWEDNLVDDDISDDNVFLGINEMYGAL
jgi:hypothetical protein